jgi:hypothetical protein
VQSAFVLVLIAVLVAAVVSFAIMGLRQRRRAAGLSRSAHQMGLRFSGDDPFDIPRRYADFVLIGSGHSARAGNVTYGRLEGMPFRAFDYRFEVGHGTQRMTRSYGVIVVETERQAPPVMMWNERDRQCIPLEAMPCQGRTGSWFYRGDERLAETLGLAAAPLAEKGLGLQTLRNVLLLWMPVARFGRDQAAVVQGVAGVVRSLSSALAAPAGGQESAPQRNPPEQNVENPEGA